MQNDGVAQSLMSQIVTMVKGNEMEHLKNKIRHVSTRGCEIKMVLYGDMPSLHVALADSSQALLEGTATCQRAGSLTWFPPR